MVRFGSLPLPQFKSGKMLAKEDCLVAWRQCYIVHLKSLVAARTQKISILKGPNLSKTLPWSTCIF